ncbi:TRAP transporter small permease [Gracilibacillus caseinilyticus]|uniref:TRAP transporter small permease n=1 Tax=Gracilibacillus caseinilyticus TaxID=2932256 RepID=A0ABY4EYK7_9BACI|nr:TRAP transporter small permease [Gracilibacillus caseinilyticus]UOQ48932.1 TRAP transporter small permease [Gracilibacillus caseinilyticus]
MKLIAKIEEFVIAFTLLIVTVLLFVNIILRYAFANNTTWAEEFIRYGMIWITFIGASVCFRRGLHVGVDLLMDVTKGIANKAVKIVVHLASITFMIFLIKYSTDLVLFTQKTGQITPSLQIPLHYIYLAIPIGSTLSLIHLVIQTINIIRNKEDVNVQDRSALETIKE